MITKSNNKISFLKKVMICLVIHLLIFLIVASLPLASESIRRGLASVYIVGICILLFGLLLLLVVYNVRSMKRPWWFNIGCYVVFCVCYSTSMTIIGAVSSSEVVFSLAVMQLLSATSLLVYAVVQQAKGGRFLMIPSQIFSAGPTTIAMLVCEVVFPDSASGIATTWLATLFLFALMLYDLKLIVQGRYKELNFDDYILVSILLFIDVLGFFMLVSYCLTD